MARNAAPRLVEQQLAQAVAMLAEVAHLLEDRLARRWQYAAGDDVADLTARMAADDGEGAGRSHGRRAYRGEPNVPGPFGSPGLLEHGVEVGRFRLVEH